MGPETRIAADRFLKIPGVTQALADALLDQLVTDGVVDASGLRLQHIEDVASYEPDWSQLAGQPTGPDFEPAFFQDEVLRQLKIVWARHVVSNQFRDEQIDWFLRYLPNNADMDFDGDTDFDDIDDFILGLNNATDYRNEYRMPPATKGDADGDGDLDFDDIAGFVQLLNNSMVSDLQEVPEPGSWALLLYATAGVLLFARSRLRETQRLSNASSVLRDDAERDYHKGHEEHEG